MIYLDYAATTPVAEEVIEVMMPFFRQQFANASSVDHILGSKAKEAVERAREQVALSVGAQSEDVIFTSGSTEANNLALSVSLPISTTPVEHPSVLDVLRARDRDTDTLLVLSPEGLVLAEDLAKTMKQRRCLISVIATNNETGIEQDLDMLASITNNSGSLLHLDATQAVGTRTIDMRKRNIAACSLSAHKVYGPKGVGALVISSAMRRELHPILHGGGHERGMRSGTLNVPGIVGFGAAMELVRKHRAERRNRLSALQERFCEVLSETTEQSAVRTIQGAPTSPHILSVRITGTNARALIRSVRNDVAFSLGSACATNKAEPSHVLTALGIDKKAITETIRCSFSSEQTFEEVEKAATAIGEAARALAGYSVSP
jgi:cysteine desulfurase